MLDSLNMTNFMAKENINGETEKYILVDGFKVCKMEKGNFSQAIKQTQGSGSTGKGIKNGSR